MGSPSDVPVPCREVTFPRAPDSLQTSVISLAWDGPCGAEMPPVVPLCPAPLPSRTASMLPSSTSEPTVAPRSIDMPLSLRPYPSAEISAVLHLPTGDNACSIHILEVVRALSIMLTPCAKACSPECLLDSSALRAKCTPTRLDEHAVSQDTARPRKLLW